MRMSLKATLVVCLLLWGGSVCAFGAEKAKGPVKVFLLMGQSNMNGRGTVGGLDKLIKDLPEKYPPSLMKIRDDVWILGANGFGISEQKKNYRLEPGFGQWKYFGPELAFGHAVGDYFEEPVLLIKSFGGGTPLATNWISPSAAKRRGEKGPLDGYRGSFQGSFKKVKQICENLELLYDEYDPKQGYQLMGILWVHGNADAGKFAEQYEDNLADFITDWRTAFGLPDLPFVAVESLSSRAPGKAYQNAVDRVNKAAGNTQAVAILAKSKIDLKGDKNYSVYNASGDATHWHYNARAYLDVGYWAAELMKPKLEASRNHATCGVHDAWEKFDKLIDKGNAANPDPAWEAQQAERREKEKAIWPNNILMK